MTNLDGNVLLAPIALFTFKRPEHTRRTLESLMENAEFIESPLFIYCDGARNEEEMSQVEETRQLVRDWAHPNKIIIERDKNWGLANSVIAGVTDLCERFGRVIVVEDDLIVSPVFLNYMNTALSYYQNESKVMQISGHMFPVDIKSEYDAVMLPFTTSWGWATWDRAWKYFDAHMEGYKKLKVDKALRRKFDLDGAYPYYKMLNHQASGKIDSWAICWRLSCFMNGGLILYPKKTLVLNEGFDGSGVNCDKWTEGEDQGILASQKLNAFPDVDLSESAFRVVRAYLSSQNNFSRRFFRKIMRLVGVVS